MYISTFSVEEIFPLWEIVGKPLPVSNVCKSAPYSTLTDSFGVDRIRKNSLSISSDEISF